MGQRADLRDAPLAPRTEPLTVAGGVVRYIAALLVGCDIAQVLPPPVEQAASNQAWGVSALLGAAYLLACVESLVPAWRERQEGTPRRWGGVAFHLIWMALATLPYALAIPGAQLQSRYGWQGSMALAGLVGCAWPLIARTRASAIQWGAAVAVACTACAITLSGSVSRATLPDDTGSLISQAREATRERGPSGRLFVYQRASDQQVLEGKAIGHGLLPAMFVGGEGGLSGSGCQRAQKRPHGIVRPLSAQMRKTLSPAPSA